MPFSIGLHVHVFLQSGFGWGLELKQGASRKIGASLYRMHPRQVHLVEVVCRSKVCVNGKLASQLERGAHRGKGSWLNSCGAAMGFRIGRHTHAIKQPCQVPGPAHTCQVSIYGGRLERCLLFLRDVQTVRRIHAYVSNQTLNADLSFPPLLALLSGNRVH